MQRYYTVCSNPTIPLGSRNIRDLRAWLARPPQAIPTGHPDCFTGMTFVISGVLDSLSRQDAADLVKRHGGKVTGSVSGKTKFLLCGTECGNSKWGGAREKSECKLVLGRGWKRVTYAMCSNSILCCILRNCTRRVSAKRWSSWAVVQRE